MIINSNNRMQRNILTNKCYYLTVAQIMLDFKKKGYRNPADETVKAVNAYQDVIEKKDKNHFSKDYNEAFAHIDSAIKKMANQVFYNLDDKSFDAAYAAFKDFDHISAVLGRRHL